MLLIHVVPTLGSMRMDQGLNLHIFTLLSFDSEGPFEGVNGFQENSNITREAKVVGNTFLVFTGTWRGKEAEELTVSRSMEVVK